METLVTIHEIRDPETGQPEKTFDKRPARQNNSIKIEIIFRLFFALLAFSRGERRSPLPQIPEIPEFLIKVLYINI